MSSSSSVPSAEKPGSTSSSPSKRMIGGRPSFRWTSLAPRSTAALRIFSRSTCGELSVMWLSASELLWGKELGGGSRPENALARRREEDRREGQDGRLPGVDRVVDAHHRALHLRRRVDPDVLVGDEPALEVGALDVDALPGDHVVRL